MKRLEHKTAIVTGAAHGIGRAIAELYAEEGARVVLADIDEEAGEAAADAIRQTGANATFCKADVSSQDDVARVVTLAAGESGRVDVLCNNAAYLGEFHAVTESTPDEWNRCIQVSLFGTHNFTKAVLPYMIARRQGSIVNVVSIQAMVGCPTSVAYTTVKSGLLGYTLSAAYDYGPQNVRVNALCPGPIQTRISPKPGAACLRLAVRPDRARPRRHAARSGVRRRLPRVGRSVVHHRRRHPRRRRLDLQVAQPSRPCGPVR